MAAADYRICDRCGNKAFYDANLGYENDHAVPRIAGEDVPQFVGLYNLGDWAVLCRDCAETHRTLIAPIEPVAWMVYSVDGASVRVTDNPSEIADGERAPHLFDAAYKSLCAACRRVRERERRRASRYNERRP